MAGVLRWWRIEVRQLAKRTEEATSEISGLVEGISSSVGVTVDALEGSVTDAKSNIDRLPHLADETIISSQRVQEMRTSMIEVDSLMESQGQTVNRITSTVSALSASAKTLSPRPLPVLNAPLFLRMPPLTVGSKVKSRP